ncbi:MAG: Rpn family recombination-promoting nuclease/putative transposase, partial [Oscillospiraceae bacterium]|nr:Rpn family recombination-promoting nuclease/putative transposase [Oscillospiraceae bacterium]
MTKMDDATPKRKEKPMTNIIKLKLDIVFKKTFTEHDDLLKFMLMHLLNLSSITKIVIKSSELLPDGINGKFVRMDLNLEADGKLINVEMQYGIDANYKDRALLYWSRLYSSGAKSGKSYSE